MSDDQAGPPKFFDVPPARTKPFTLADVNAALDELRDAARLATTPGPSMERFVPGLSIALVFRENGGFRLRHHEGFGVKDLGRSELVGADTLFPCASLSKPVSASLIAANGNGKWDDVVKQRNGEPYKLAASAEDVTLRDWLSHTSGLPDHAGDLIEDMHPSMSRDDIIRNIMKFQTGLDRSKSHYTNFGYTMGCLGAMHALSATDWESFSTAALRSLGMEHSTYVFTSAFDPGAGDRVVPHRHVPAESEDGGWHWRVAGKHEERNPSRQAPAGSLISSARDMVAFLEAHLDRRFGDFPPRGVAGGPHGYSLGWNVADYSRLDGFTNAINATSFSHSGAFLLGAATHVRIDPDAGIGIAILTNGEPAGIPETLVRIFFNHLYEQPGRNEFERDGKLDYGTVLAIFRAKMLELLNAKKNENRKRYASDARHDIPSAIPQGVVFRGRSDFYGCDVVVERNGDELSLSMGEQAGGRPFWRFSLRCYDPDRFLFVHETRGENEVGVSGVRLERGANGAFHTLIDEWLDQTEPGEESGTGVGVIRAGRPGAAP